MLGDPFSPKGRSYSNPMGSCPVSGELSTVQREWWPSGRDSQWWTVASGTVNAGFQTPLLASWLQASSVTVTFSEVHAEPWERGFVICHHLSRARFMSCQGVALHSPGLLTSVWLIGHQGLVWLGRRVCRSVIRHSSGSRVLSSECILFSFIPLGIGTNTYCTSPDWKDVLLGQRQKQLLPEGNFGTNLPPTIPDLVTHPGVCKNRAVINAPNSTNFACHPEAFSPLLLFLQTHSLLVLVSILPQLSAKKAKLERPKLFQSVILTGRVCMEEEERERDWVGVTERDRDRVRRAENEFLCREGKLG